MDLHNELKISRVLSPVAAALADDTAQVGQIIDGANFDALEYAIITGTLADAGATFTVLLEESADSGMSGANAVDDADLVGTEALASFTQADDNVVKKLGYIGSKRYTRMTITPSGNAAAAPLAVIAIQSRARKHPVA